MRVLITGISGFLGWNLARRFQAEPGCVIVGTHLRHPPPAGVESREMDLERPTSIREAVFAVRPDILIHTAAMSAVSACEAQPERARRVNGSAVAVLAKALDPRRTHLVYCSTDLVFDGVRPPYREGDMRTPRNVYGTTKAAGEREALAYKGSSAVARLALMYGDGPPASPSFLGWLDAGLRDEAGVRVFHDEIRTALYVQDAVEGLAAIARRRATGLFHLAGPEALSRETFARLYARVFGLDEARVRRIAQADAGPGPYRAPDVSLDITRARRELGFAPRPIEEALLDLKTARGL